MFSGWLWEAGFGRRTRKICRNCKCSRDDHFSSLSSDAHTLSTQRTDLSVTRAHVTRSNLSGHPIDVAPPRTGQASDSVKANNRPNLPIPPTPAFRLQDGQIPKSSSSIPPSRISFPLQNNSSMNSNGSDKDNFAPPNNAQCRRNNVGPVQNQPVPTNPAPGNMFSTSQTNLAHNIQPNQSRFNPQHGPIFNSKCHPNPSVHSNPSFHHRQNSQNISPLGSQLGQNSPSASSVRSETSSSCSHQMKPLMTTTMTASHHAPQTSQGPIFVGPACASTPHPLSSSDSHPPMTSNVCTVQPSRTTYASGISGATGPVFVGVGATSDPQRHSQSDDDSGCALEEYTWTPPGLKSEQVHLYFSGFPDDKIPYLNSIGDKYRVKQLLYQLPPQDNKVVYCTDLDPLEAQELRNFSMQRRRQNLGRATAKQLPIPAKQSSACAKCCEPLTGGDIVVTAAPHAPPSAQWHPSCFSCLICRELLVDLIYFWADGELYCGRHHAERSKPRCAACDEIIFSDECTEAENRAWHMKHFACYECDAKLGGLKYIMREGKPFCVECYHAMFAEYCETCGDVIGVDQGQMSHEKLSWHASPNCFVCKNCNVSLIQKPFLPRQGTIFCSLACSKGEPPTPSDGYPTPVTEQHMPFVHANFKAPVGSDDEKSFDIEGPFPKYEKPVPHDYLRQHMKTGEALAAVGQKQDVLNLSQNEKDNIYTGIEYEKLRPSFPINKPVAPSHYANKSPRSKRRMAPEVECSESVSVCERSPNNRRKHSQVHVNKSEQNNQGTRKCSVDDINLPRTSHPVISVYRNNSACGPQETVTPSYERTPPIPGRKPLTHEYVNLNNINSRNTPSPSSQHNYAHQNDVHAYYMPKVTNSPKPPSRPSSRASGRQSSMEHGPSPKMTRKLMEDKVDSKSNHSKFVSESPLLMPKPSTSPKDYESNHSGSKTDLSDEEKYMKAKIEDSDDSATSKPSTSDMKFLDSEIDKLTLEKSLKRILAEQGISLLHEIATKSPGTLDNILKSKQSGAPKKIDLNDLSDLNLDTLIAAYQSQRDDQKSVSGHHVNNESEQLSTGSGSSTEVSTPTGALKKETSTKDRSSRSVRFDPEQIYGTSDSGSRKSTSRRKSYENSSSSSRGCREDDSSNGESRRHHKKRSSSGKRQARLSKSISHHGDFPDPEPQKLSRNHRTRPSSLSNQEGINSHRNYDSDSSSSSSSSSSDFDYDLPPRAFGGARINYVPNDALALARQQQQSKSSSNFGHPAHLAGCVRPNEKDKNCIIS